MNNIYTRIETLLKMKGMSNRDLENELGFSNSSIVKWKTSTPKYERLKKVADYFEIPTDILLGNSTDITCPICNFSYNPLDHLQVYTHNKYHDHLTKPSNNTCSFGSFDTYFNFDLDWYFDEEIVSAYKGFCNNTLSENERLSIYDTYLKASFVKHICDHDPQEPPITLTEFCKQKILELTPNSTISTELILKIAQLHDVELSRSDIAQKVFTNAAQDGKLLDLLILVHELDDYHRSLLGKIIIDFHAHYKNNHQKLSTPIEPINQDDEFLSTTPPIDPAAAGQLSLFDISSDEE